MVGQKGVSVAPLKLRAVLLSVSVLADEKSFAHKVLDDPLLIGCGTRVDSSQPCPLAEEMVPAQRHEKGIKHSTLGTTRASAPWKVREEGTNCMTRKKTIWWSDEVEGLSPRMGAYVARSLTGCLQGREHSSHQSSFRALCSSSSGERSVFR